MISIVVPVYNTAKYLTRCIESILCQTYTSFELLLVDDGSSDESGEICIAYAEKDERVRLIQMKNRGVAAARNTGLDLADGEYITFVDSDDWIEPNMYAHMMQIVDEYRCDVVLCDCIKDFKDSQEVYSHAIRSGFYDFEQLKREYYPHLLMMENVEYPATISNWLMLFRAKKMNKRYPAGLVRYVEGIKYSEDLLFGSEIMMNVKSFYYMKNNCLYHYCINSDSSTRVWVGDKWNDYHQVFIAANEKFKNTEYDFSDQIYKVLLFFVYKSIGDICSDNHYSFREKYRLLDRILSDNDVQEVFNRIKIRFLPINYKLKILTYMFKYKMSFLIICTLER